MNDVGDYSPATEFVWYCHDENKGGRYLPPELFEQLDGGFYLTGSEARYGSMQDAMDDLKQARKRLTAFKHNRNRT